MNWSNERAAEMARQLREDDARMEDAPWTIVGQDGHEFFGITARDGRNEIAKDLAPDDALGIARTRNSLREVADLLDAARGRIAELEHTHAAVPRKEWTFEAWEAGTQMDSSDYVDGWNDALDAVRGRR